VENKGKPSRKRSNTPTLNAVSNPIRIPIEEASKILEGLGLNQANSEVISRIEESISVWESLVEQDMRMSEEYGGERKLLADVRTSLIEIESLLFTEPKYSQHQPVKPESKNGIEVKPKAISSYIYRQLTGYLQCSGGRRVSGIQRLGECKEAIHDIREAIEKVEDNFSVKSANWKVIDYAFLVNRVAEIWTNETGQAFTRSKKRLNNRDPKSYSPTTFLLDVCNLTKYPYPKKNGISRLIRTWMENNPQQEKTEAN